MACVLGIDIGTSTVKAILIEKERKCVLEEAFQPLSSQHAEVEAINERKTDEIWTCLEKCMKSLSLSKLQNVCAIGVCGQMHGCVLWNDKAKRLSNSPSNTLTSDSCYNLITWQDGRCSKDFLSSLPMTRQRVPLSSGYGCATLAWLQRYKPGTIKSFNKAGTIMDLVIWRLCSAYDEKENQPVLMSAQNAVSWGYFDASRMQWELDVLKDTDFPVQFLPAVVAAPSLAGSLRVSWQGIPPGTPVCVGMGDLQCSILATNPSPSDAILNIGSASQLSVIEPANTKLVSQLPASVMEVPYFKTDSLIVAASLTGANIFATLVETVSEWIRDLGVCSNSVPPNSEMYKRLIELAESKIDTSLSVQVTLWGERYQPELASAVFNAKPVNVSIGDVSSATLKGIVENLQAMMPSQLFQTLQIEKLLGSGSALQRNPVLQHHAKTVFNLPLEMRQRADAPLGAALAAQELAKTNGL